MGFFLAKDAVGHVDVSVSATTNAVWNVKFKMKAPPLSGADRVYTLLGLSANIRNSIQIEDNVTTSTNAIVVRASGLTRTLDCPDNDFTVEKDYEIDSDGTSTRLYIDGVLTYTNPASSALDTTLNFIGKRTTIVDPAWDLYYLQLTNGVTLAEDFQPDDANGTGSILPNRVGTDGTLTNLPTDGSQWGSFNSLTPDQLTVKPGDAITWTTNLTSLTAAWLQDSNGSQYALTSVTDTGGTIPALAGNLQACVFGAVELYVTDGVSNGIAAVTLDPPTGYALTTLTFAPTTPSETDWVFGFNTPAVVGDQSLENSSIITHNTDGTITWTPQALTYTYYTVLASDGTMSAITKTFDDNGDLVVDGYVKSIVRSIVQPVVQSIVNPIEKKR